MMSWGEEKTNIRKRLFASHGLEVSCSLSSEDAEGLSSVLKDEVPSHPHADEGDEDAHEELLTSETQRRPF